MASVTPLLDLAETISNATLTLTRHQLSTSTPPPSLEARDAAVSTSDGIKKSAEDQQKVAEAHVSLLQATTDLQILVYGPADYLKSLSYTYHDITALAVVVEFNIHKHVPPDRDISFANLATASGAPKQRLERVLRLLIVRRIFQESRPGYVAHNAVSQHLYTHPELAAFLGHCTHEAFPAASRLVDSLRKYPDSELPSNAGFNIAFNTEDPLFTFLAKNPDRFDRFNLGMAGISAAHGRSAQQVIEGYDWASLGQATVIDVGGGNGHISLALAEAYPKLSLVVQDLEGAISAGKAMLPPHLADRVQFEEFNMFQPQTRKDVDVFYLRHILHDWPDDHAIKILQALVPALKPGSRIIISDSVIPPAEHLKGLHEKFVRYLDLQMMVLHNARERTEEDFKDIITRADPRLKFKQVWRKGPDAAASTIVEAIFE